MTSFEQLDDDHGRTLIGIARRAIHEAFGEPSTLPVFGAWLDEHCASFVTLKRDGALRGCVGSTSARRPLRDDVAANARAAALNDPRFPPLAANELERTRVEVSVLSVPVPLVYNDRFDLVSKLRPFVDGVVIAHGPRSATFLPQVWEALPHPADFIDELMRKAGLATCTIGECRVERYHVRKWCEAELSDVRP